MFTFGQKSFGQGITTEIYLGAGNSNYRQQILIEAAYDTEISPFNSNYFLGAKFSTPKLSFLFQIGHSNTYFEYSNSSGNSSFSPQSNSVSLKSLDTKFIVGLLPLPLGKRLKFTPQFSFTALYIYDGINLKRTYYPYNTTINNSNYLYTKVEMTGVGTSFLTGLHTEFNIVTKWSVFMINEFGLTHYRNFLPVSFYNSVGLSFKLNKNEKSNT